MTTFGDIPGTTVYAAKSALFQMLQAQNVDKDVLVAYGIVGTFQPNGIVYLGKVTRSVTAARFRGDAGYGRYDEDYIIEVGVSLFRGGEDAYSAEGDAWDLVNLVERTVRSDPSLQGTVSEAGPVAADLTPAWEEQHKGVLFDGTVHIRCIAVI